MEIVERYTWSDALVEAQTKGVIENGALLLAMKLAKAINWKPKNKRPAGLYWKNEDALAEVGASRATYYKHMPSLVETGFFTRDKGNLLPAMPQKSLVETSQDTQKSLVETGKPQIEPQKSLLETTESLVETGKSLVDRPLSVDILSEDELSEEETTTDAASSAVEITTSSNSKEVTPTSPRPLKLVPPSLRDEVEEAPQSLVETFWDGMDDWQLEQLHEEVERLGATEEQTNLAWKFYNNRHNDGWTHRSRCRSALVMAGAEDLSEDWG